MRQRDTLRMLCGSLEEFIRMLAQHMPGTSHKDLNPSGLSGSQSPVVLALFGLC